MWINILFYNPIAMDTKMQGTGCVTKMEKDNEQILWFAGIVSEFLAVQLIPSSSHLVLQIILKSISKVLFYLAIDPSQDTEIISIRQFQISSAPNLG